MRTLAAICALALTPLATVAAPAEPGFDREDALSISQAAIGRPLADVTLRGTDGQNLDLAELTRKPLIVSLIYTSCHHVCPLITRNIQETADIAREALGDEAFTLVSIGFDWQVDTPEQMRLYAASHGIDDPDWYFLSGDATSIPALTDSLGFQFLASATGFDHLAQTTIVRSDGIIYRQVYGPDFDTQAFVEPLKELVFDTPADAGLVEHWVDTLKLFCTVYDPNTGRYAFDYSIFMSLAIGVLCLGAILTFVLLEWKQAR